ncbi:R-spondin-3-like isoform X2 [Pempheris klunzingeri]|uniref:R-spondin-3-like isoform X2 n=1 Tax=Pempheris klunzingeri TaxID=3127111 RepID=UPI00397F6C77
MAACPVNLASSSTWSWMGCGRGAPVCPPVPEVTMTCERHTSTPALVGCREDCASCFSENFCTHCHPGHFLFQGKCENSCPNGLTANTALRECTECSLGCEVCVRRNMCVRCRADLYFLHGQCHLTCPKGFEPDVQLMQCTPQVHCEVGEWTDWGPCVRRKSVRSYRRGQETRTRQVLQPPSVFGNPCPHVSEIRKCVIKKRLKSPSRL